MTTGEKERFCSFAAALFAPPEAALMDDLRQDALHARINEYVREWGGDTGLLPVFFEEAGREGFLSALEEEYERLFVRHGGARISLVESAYKPWTMDKDCGMVFAASKGLVMGDAAVHMQDIYRQLSLEVPGAFRSTPDHLVLELEFLALLYESASHEQTKQFIEDHLNWISELKAAMKKADPHPFYLNAVELIHLFLQDELKNGKGEADG